MNRPLQLPLPLNIRPTYAPIDFVNTPCQQDAFAWIQKWPDWSVPFVTIWGETGCGKTHLAHVWRNRSDALYLPMAHILRETPLHWVEQAPALILDDVDQGLDALGDSGQKALFHLYNLFREASKNILFLSSCPPLYWPVTLPDLKSRLSTILSLEISPPDEEALRIVLFKRLSERGLKLSEDVQDYILKRIERSFESIALFVAEADALTLSTKRSLTLPLVREMMQQG